MNVMRFRNYRWQDKWILLPVFLLCLLIFSGKLRAQKCTGSLGDPVVNIDFGRGSSYYGPPLDAGITSYHYVANEGPYDGSYTIAQTIGNNGAWFFTRNHTPNDPTGYMMMINASFDPGVFYQTKVAAVLCPNTLYEFGAWVINLGRYNGISPNLTFTVLDLDDHELASWNTGPLAETETASWVPVGFSFNTGGASQVKISIRNNAPGGGGNDLAIDDVVFRACGPVMTADIDNSSLLEKTVCGNENTPVVLKTTVQGSATLQYIWQEQTGSDWIEISGETSGSLNLTPSALSVGDHRYRMVAAEASNFNNPVCRTASPVLTIHVNPAPKITVVANQVVCIGNPINLDVTGADGTYLWAGPNDYLSTEKSPVIDNADFSRSGMYTVVVTSGNCAANATIDVQVKPVPVAVVSPDVTICEGLRTSLNASGGTTYKWSPEAGLSATNVPHPMASPNITTLYTVSVSNGGCADTGRIIVTVIKKITANAGKNKVIIVGQGIKLDGAVTGEQFRYFWTPSDYLNDPAKLNPMASPPKDMTYTLNAWSEGNCPGSTSTTFVKVYPRLEIPNTFSPNGDGINDIWNVEALQAYPDATIGIYNRYGEKVFSSTDHVKNWDGRYRGTPVPVGIYYYIINLHNSKKPVSGSMMVLR